MKKMLWKEQKTKTNEALIKKFTCHVVHDMSYMSRQFTCLICHLKLFMLDYTTVFSSFFSTMQKTGDLVLQKKRHNMLKKEKPKVKKKIIFDEEMRHQAEYENKCMSFEKDNRLLKR